MAEYHKHRRRHHLQYCHYKPVVAHFLILISLLTETDKLWLRVVRCDAPKRLSVVRL